MERVSLFFDPFRVEKLARWIPGALPPAMFFIPFGDAGSQNPPYGQITSLWEIQ